MRDENGSVLIALIALVAVIAVVEGIFLIKLSSRVGELETALSGRTGGDSPVALGKRMQVIEDLATDTAIGLDSVAKATERVERENRAQATAIERVQASLRSAPAGEPVPPRTAEPLPAAALQEVVARTVDERLKEVREQGGGGEWKPSLQQFQEALDLSEEQVLRAEEIFDDAKHEVFRLANLRRDDGTAKIDDFVSAMQDEEPERAMKKVFAGLFTEKIPGRQETYIVEILRIRNRTEQGLSGILDEEQRKKLGRLNIDYLGVKTAYDPFAEYIQESLR
jgi:hypothetical protein